MSDRRREEAFRRAMEDIWDGVAMLRFAAQELPLQQRHIFLQAVNRLVDIAGQVVGLFEPVDVDV